MTENKKNWYLNEYIQGIEGIEKSLNEISKKIELEEIKGETEITRAVMIVWKEFRTLSKKHSDLAYNDLTKELYTEYLNQTTEQFKNFKDTIPFLRKAV